MRRKGSALLIVLGMLSFMVVSAVSFAMFMRQSRLPSSYLRRSSTSRYLLKAALANAIARIDGALATDRQIWGRDEDSMETGWCEGVYDDPYPGVGPVSDQNRNGNLWVKRVFCPFGVIPASADEEINGKKERVSTTVSTLTLEGLAYLPPSIINEARTYSRMTRTALWRNLAYDAGRYAFCAVDVSDCFDINKLLANERRTSAANHRVNLSSLYPQNGGQLDEILTRWDDDKIPFVSVADYNIMAENSPFAPFYRYVGTAGDPIYNASHGQTVSNALFITDTWFPPTNTVAGAKVYDLEAGEENQPFKGPLTRPSSARDLLRKCTAGLGDVLQGQLGFIGIACLYDYLDKDSRPLSYCLPCTETAAMVCGLGLGHNQRMNPVVKAGKALTGTLAQPVTEDGKTWTVKRTATPYVLSSFFQNMSLNGLAAFPFKRAGTKGYNAKFKGEALVKVLMAPKDMKCRLPGDSALYPAVAGDWKDGEADGVVTRLCKIESFSFDNDIKTTEKALKFFDCAIGGADNLNWPAYWKVEDEYEELNPPENQQPQTKSKTYYSMDGVGGNVAGSFKPHDADGKVADWWEKLNCAKEFPRQPQWEVGVPADHTAALVGRTEQYVPHVLVWMRLIAADGKDSGETIDVVPARPEDDKTWGKFDLGEVVGQMGGAIGDDTTPVLEFRGDSDKAFKYNPDPQAVDGLSRLENSPPPHTFTVSDSWNMLYAVDPRYNFAPENWFAVQGTNDKGGEVTEQDWIDRVCAAGGPLGGGNDTDVFMFTSDQEYLQSIGELAFLPAVEDLNAGMDVFAGTYANSVSLTVNNAPDFLNRVMERPSANLNGFACRDFMWRTYTAYNRGDGIDPIYALRDGANPVVVTAGRGDFRANPFSPDMRVLMAVLKDTPFDYFVTSTNETLNATWDAEPKNRSEFAFCPESSVAKLDDDELDDIAAELRAKFDDWARQDSMVRFNWEAAFTDILWRDTNDRLGDDQKTIFGITEDFQEPLHGVDRKFLHSFWRECFQNRQQLFLVFIRAEPLTVGSMGKNSLANAQLGAHGVALVWRDPAPPVVAGAERSKRDSLTGASSYYNNDDFAPHQTRVLFYHQFE